MKRELALTGLMSALLLGAVSCAGVSLRVPRFAVKGLVSRVVTAEEGWHRYARLVSLKGQAEFEALAVRHIGTFINAPNPDIHMLYRMFLTNVSMVSLPAGEPRRVTNHPLRIWYEKNQDLLACDWEEEDEARRRKIIKTWKSWARNNAARFERDLREYQMLVNAR